jgi:glycosyltransferase involved in cell wall biosynthesis
MTKPHVCFVAPHIWPVLVGDRSIAISGGAETRQSILARALVRAGFRVTVITLDFGQPELSMVDGITVIRTHKEGAGFPGIRFFFPRLTSWWSGLGRADADIYIQSTAAYLTAVVAYFCGRHGKCFIYSGASDPDFDYSQLWKKFQGRLGWRDSRMYQWGLRRADGIVAQHKGQVEACRRWYDREAVEIPNCYAPPLTDVAGRDGVILWVGTVKSLKRPELFLDLARRLPHLQFRMVGGAGQGAEAAVFAKIRQSALTLSNVEFVGFVPFVDVETHFDAARLFVNTSDYEGFPNTFLQSWARGIPTVSFFNCGAEHGERSIGYVCKDLAEMGAVTLRLSEDDLLWAQEGERAKTYFEANHSVDMAVAKYSQLFEQVQLTKASGK